MSSRLPPHYRDLQYQKDQFERNIASFPDDEQVRLHEALIFAEDAHSTQTRDEGDPYIIHLIRAARILAEDITCRDADMLIATLLHDVVEDTKETLKTIRERFGARVAEFVHALTQDKENETKQAYIERIIAGPLEVRLMKAADKLDNVRSASLLPPESKKRAQYVQLTKDLFLPLAESTGEQYFVNEMQKALAHAQTLS